MERKVRIRHTVHFPQSLDALEEVIVYVTRCRDMPEEEKSLKWFSKTDFVLFKRTAQMIARSSQDFGMSAVLAKCYKDDEEPSQESQHRLNQWSRHGTIRRGLEYWCSSELASRRSKSMSRLMNAVLQAQKEMRESDDNSFVDPSVLAAVSRAHSSAGRRFARMLGVADASAVEPPAANSPQARMFRLGQRHRPRIPQWRFTPVTDRTADSFTADETEARRRTANTGNTTQPQQNVPGTDQSAYARQRLESFQSECKSPEQEHRATRRRQSKRSSRDKTFASTAA